AEQLRTRDEPASRFIELAAPTWSETSQVKITLPGGAVVALPAQASAELITVAIRAAMSVGSEARPC
ncbi:MAG: hypothetical protein ACKOEC_20485, partial [Acidimicrobiia bacterium]